MHVSCHHRKGENLPKSEAVLENGRPWPTTRTRWAQRGWAGHEPCVPLATRPCAQEAGLYGQQNPGLPSGWGQPKGGTSRRPRGGEEAVRAPPGPAVALPVAVSATGALWRAAATSLPLSALHSFPAATVTHDHTGGFKTMQIRPFGVLKARSPSSVLGA